MIMDCEIKRELAKIGMASTLGVTVVTALKMKGSNKRIHVLAGTLFVGLAVWHHSLYEKKSTPQMKQAGTKVEK